MNQTSPYGFKRKLSVFRLVALTSLLLLFFLNLKAQTTGITLEDIWASPKFASRGAEAIRWMKDDATYSRLERKESALELNVYNVRTGERSHTYE
jgi:hypothetical protein